MGGTPGDWTSETEGPPTGGCCALARVKALDGQRATEKGPKDAGKRVRKD